ncbi:unnamed protein product [Nippostrongylus brasiliensis]|uniref:G_PROTEIN_RECEP_F1_2 domain-containing protein n=1 Tax=Nippostrongylus brasiliensis TaxID=27835 RepID=A0A0N4YRI4_NIPBR|nr:unnamed protein product [Nippostrongylus brasiliensis]
MVPWDAATCLLMVGVGAERLIATRRHLPNAVISNCVKVCPTTNHLSDFPNTFYKNAQESVKKRHWCSAVNTLMVPWDAATCLLMVGVGAERLIATRRHLPNAVISNCVKVIFFLVGCAALFVTINYFLNLTRFAWHDFSDQGVCICDGASLPDRYAMLFRICVCTMVEVGTISLFGYVLILSRSEADGMGINVAKYSLSKRFQIHETYRTTQMLLPSAVLHAVLYLSYLCLLIPVRNIRAEKNLTVLQYNLSTIIFAFPTVYGLAHPLLLFLLPVVVAFNPFRGPCGLTYEEGKIYREYAEKVKYGLVSFVRIPEHLTEESIASCNLFEKAQKAIDTGFEPDLENGINYWVTTSMSYTENKRYVKVLEEAMQKMRTDLDWRVKTYGCAYSLEYNAIGEKKFNVGCLFS